MLNNAKYLFIMLSLLPTLLFGQQEDQKSLSVTVYNQNLGVIRDVRSIDLKSGISKIAVTDVAQSIDPTSVHIKLNGDVLEQNYQYDLVSLNKILQKYIDNNIQLVSNNNERIEGTLLSSNGGQVVLRKSDGGLLMLPNVGNYRFSVGSLPEGLITRPTLLWTVNAPKSGKQNVEISYQTAGMNWHAEYVALLNNDDSKIDLNCWVSIENNSGATYKNASLKLVAGDVNLVSNINRPLYEMKDLQRSNTATDQFQERSFFEYHIYDLQRQTSLSQNETKQISLFETQGIRIDKKYYYGNGYYYGNNSGKIAVMVEFVNTKENGLGIPLPKGKIRIYKTDGESNEFVGEDMIGHTPNKEKIRLKIGNAFDVLAEESQTDHKKISNKVYEDSYEIILKNRKKENITVEVERYLGLNWEVLNSSIEYLKKNAQTIIFEVPVNKDSETKLTYTVRYSN